MPSPEYPFYFAWADPTETTFGPQHEVVDEDIFSFVIAHEEGQIPTLDLTIKNPRIGLLNPGRKVWAWLSYGPPSGAVEPLFFGELVGIPTNIYAELVTLKFHARPVNYIEEKQAVAETLKVRPFYDEIFIETSKRDDPDAVLEGWSSLYHVDRTTLAVSASDILTGEDGTIDFGSPTSTQAFYDSLNLTTGEAPLTNIRVEANVRWTQRYDGLLPWDTVNVATYTGDGFMGDWPKAGTSIGSGWKVESSYVYDQYLVGVTPTTTYNYSWTRGTSDTPSNCDPQSIQVSDSGPALLSPDPITCQLLGRYVTGICDPYADPPVNRAAHVEGSGIIIPQWFLAADMTLRYDAKRQFSEQITFNVLANTQGVLTSPLVAQHTEVIKISGADVGEPLEEPDAWSDYAGQAVVLGDVIFPNDPRTPGGTSWQICVVAGTAGTVEPVFSDIPGTVTVDNTVQWASMGENPLGSTPRWTNSSPVPEGEIICFIPQYKQEYFNTGAADFEASLTEAAYYICTQAGVTNSVFTNFTYIPPVTSNDEFTPIPVNVQYIADPTFNATPGAQITDGSVVWTSLGLGGIMQIPIGGTPLKVGARCYFPTPRGLQSVEFLICKARARIRKRARCVNISWNAPFTEGIPLSCRKDATIQDPRLPGGSATGKIISYKLCFEAGGKWYTQVEIGCSVGYAGTVAADAGTGAYASSGYMQSGYQQTISSVVTPTDNADIGYTPPIFSPFDDGITFPITSTQEVRAGEAISNTAANQAAALKAACPATALLQQLANPFPVTTGANGGNQTTFSGISFDGAWALENAQRQLNTATIQYQMQADAVSWELFLKPLDAGPFNGTYGLTITPLELPQGINLEATSSP